MSKSVLEVAGLAFAYDGALAVRDVSLTVQPSWAPTARENPPRCA
jgi:ABC-type branched-subunit amino acid transport system ATPase component